MLLIDIGGKGRAKMTTEEQDAVLGKVVREITEARKEYAFASVELQSIGKILFESGRELMSNPMSESKNIENLLSLNQEKFSDCRRVCKEAKEKGMRFEKQYRTLTGVDFP